MFEVILSPEAQDFYAEADRPLARKLTRCFEQLEKEPRRHSAIKMLTGDFKGFRRFRVGQWRVVYEIDDSARTVRVLSVAHRREVYE
jgi:mRNA interferase RelE/StbE